MKTIFVAALLYLSSSFIPVTRTTADKVYYCDSKGGKKYHYKELCSGLQKCTHTIKSTTLQGAKDRGLTICLLED